MSKARDLADLATNDVLETTSTGVDVTGTVTADGATFDGYVTVNNSMDLNGALFPDSIFMMDSKPVVFGSDTDVEVFWGGSYLNLQTKGNDIRIMDGLDTKVIWDASAESLGIGTSSPSANSGLDVDDSIYCRTGNRILSDTFEGYTGGATAVNLKGANTVTVTTASTERMRIDSSGNVGIGITSVDSTGYVGLETAKNIRMDMGAISADPAVYFAHDNFASPTNNYISMKRTNEAMAFQVAGSERMRIDSSGNLLVGKTSTNYNSVGVQAFASGYLHATADAGNVVTINRKTSDGDIVTFRKDGTTVGSIGVVSSRPYLASANIGIRLGASEITPSTSTGAFNNDAVDIGHPSYRFKDLYLSGGVYLGGTGSANYLDDYEEGTWTPNFSGGTVSAQGYYTKVGRQVTVVVQILNSALTGSSGLAINGLPFSNGSTTRSATSSVVHYNLFSYDNVVGIVSLGLPQIEFVSPNANDGWNGATFLNDKPTNYLHLTATYFTDY